MSSSTPLLRFIFVFFMATATPILPSLIVSSHQLPTVHRCRLLHLASTLIRQPYFHVLVDFITHIIQVGLLCNTQSRRWLQLPSGGSHSHWHDSMRARGRCSGVGFLQGPTSLRFFRTYSTAGLTNKMDHREARYDRYCPSAICSNSPAKSFLLLKLVIAATFLARSSPHSVDFGGRIVVDWRLEAGDGRWKAAFLYVHRSI